FCPCPSGLTHRPRCCVARTRRILRKRRRPPSPSLLGRPQFPALQPGALLPESVFTARQLAAQPSRQFARPAPRLAAAPPGGVVAARQRASPPPARGGASVTSSEQ